MFVAVAATAAAIDQAVKLAVVSLVAPGEAVVIAHFLELRPQFNSGASFGLFSETLGSTPLIFASLAAALVMVLAWFGIRARRRLEAIAYAVAAGGALGNIADRIHSGTVTDFIDVHFGSWHLPALNLADVMIVCGFLIVLVLSASKEKKPAVA